MGLHQPRFLHGPDRVSSQLVVLSAFLVFVFLLGGGARADVQSLLILRPASVLVCGIGLWTLTGEQVRRYRFLFILAAMIFSLVLLHLVPLPHSVWSSLPGREMVDQIDQATGLASTWRPISLVPAATWNALYSLFVPLAVLILAVQLQRSDSARLLTLLILLGVASGLIGLLQVVGPADSPLYFYQITNRGAAVGIFANRNHAAVFLACLFPMLAIFASTGTRSSEQRRFRTWISVAIAIVLVPLLLVTGSRAGAIAALVGIASTALLYRRPAIEHPGRRRGGTQTTRHVIIGGFAIASLGLLLALFSRAQAIDRLLASGQADDLRFQVWGPIATMAWKYAPIGSGIGSFVEVFQVDEPAGLLKPTYLNHAHNDWLENALTAGIPGLLIVAVILVAVVHRSITVWRSADASRPETAFARMASVILVILALGSATDYPLRAPSMMCVAVLAGVWLHGGAGRARRGISEIDGSLPNSPLADSQIPKSKI